ncbi:hypothetical protein BN946_scf184697.g23 [Trametes cinnabarina]|uniref:N-acetyltransferase domain-containing protein n=1 Tax=Pycnoporus cinnabarinus TaxID=5643 RepID=A0A060S6C1_PYCCI|nr:hypothetical protein BN946_scf184697.g23 [Trametes cinnabarina]
MAPSNLTIEHVDKPTDPAAIALTGGDISLLPDLGGAMIRALLLTPGVGEIFTARDENGSLVGFALFSLPGQLMLSTEEQQKHGFLDLMGKLSPEGQKYYVETMGKEVPKMNDQFFGIEDAERNTYWCNFAMVREDYQGKGVARALFELATKDAAKTGATIALTTTNARNVPIYEKLGFKLHGQTIMPSPWVDWPMWFFSKETKQD